MKAFAVILFAVLFTFPVFPQSLDLNKTIYKSVLKNESLNFDFHKITDIRNGYTIQSNGSPQHLWSDVNNPQFLHAVFTNSQLKDPPFPDRTCLYFGSTDAGVTWFELGSVPDTSRAGFPAIYGTDDGRAVIVNHNDYFSATTHSGLFIDLSPFHYIFSAYDPTANPVTLWPKCIVTPDGNIQIAALTQPGDSISLVTFDTTSNTFSSWIVGGTSRPEAYAFSVSDQGKLGFTYIAGDGPDDGDVFYIETTDNGITWSTPFKVFDCPSEQGIAVGAMTGIDMNFYGEEPCVVFDVCQQDFNAGIYYPRLPNEILFWSPNLNGGVPKAIADSNNVPFAPNLTSTIAQPPLSRPVLARTDKYDYLFLSFNASTEDYYLSGIDTLTYFSGYLMYSSDGGNNWSEPEKFTPDTPLLDWKYISTHDVIPVIETNQYIDLLLHFTLQADSLELHSHPSLLSAHYYHASAVPLIFDKNDSGLSPHKFLLENNYPNPFNPNTKIKYSIPSAPLSFGEGLGVRLIVYDVLGNEVATLVNEEKPAGEYEVEFSSDLINQVLPSGIYFYQLKAGNYVETKKMVLIK